MCVLWRTEANPCTFGLLRIMKGLNDGRRNLQSSGFQVNTDFLHYSDVVCKVKVRSNMCCIVSFGWTI